EQPYFANTPQGRVLIPADWDSLEMASPRIGVYAESIGARADIADVAEVEEVEQPEEIVETTQPAPVEVAEEHDMVELVPAEEINDEPAAEAESQPGVVPAKSAKDEAKAQPQVEEVKPAKAEAPKQANNQVNIAAIIGGVIAALAALGIGAAFFAMR
ncbi:hypothetical protein ACFPRI_06865, partial [Corynebacterium pilbarense]